MMDYSVLSCLLYNNELHKAVEVNADHFGSAHTQILFNTMMEVLDNGKPLDVELLAPLLQHMYPQHDWMPHLEELVQSTAAKANFSAYQEKLKEAYTQRCVKGIAHKLADDLDVPGAMDALKNVSTSPSRRGFDPERIAKSFIEHLESPPKSIPSGIGRIDDKLGGLHQSDLIVVGARPAMGKTAFAVNLALKSNAPFLFFSGEQGAEQLMERMVSIDGAVPLWKMRNRSLNQDDYRRVTDSVARIRNNNFYVVDKPSPSLQDIVSESRKQVHERGVKLILVDYLQRMKTTGDSRREAIEAAVRGLKELARELDVPVIVLAQVNRSVDNRENKHPNMGDLMESGAIEAEADQIIMLSREVVYDPSCSNPNGAMITIAKNRHGPTGRIDLHFQQEILRFSEAA